MLVGPLRPRLLDGLRFEGRFAHAHDAVDLATLLYQQAFRRDVAVHDAGGLDLEAIIGGEVRGSIRADERIEIQSTSVVHGDIAAKRLLVQEGGEINGVVRMGEAALEAETVEKAGTQRSY